MPIFRSRPREITAERLVEGQPWPDGVSFHNKCEDERAACSLDGKKFVTTIHGQQTIVEYGDRIVPEPDGVHHYPVKPEIIEKNYEPV